MVIRSMATGSTMIRSAAIRPAVIRPAVQLFGAARSTVTGSW
ncbi:MULTISPECIES: hypothetical protein [Streptomyces]